jgi:hypothetical protein
VMKEFLARAGTDRMPLSETLDLATVSMATWKASAPRRTAD